MAESSKGPGLAALVPNGLNFTKSNQSGISPQLSRALSELSKDFGHSITINSGYRSPAYNAAIGSGKGSYHTKGLAADIDMTGWSDAKRQQAIEKLSALGVGGFITYSKSPNMLHIDLRENMHFMFDKTARLMGKAPSWFKEIANKLGPKTAIQRQMAAEMEQPSEMTRAQAMATGISPEDQALANAQIAYGASRAMNAQPPSLSPPNPGALRGLATSMARRGIAPPSNFSGGTPAISPIGSAPVGTVTRGPLGPALARPSPPSNFAQGAPVSYGAPKANRLGGMDYAVAPERFGSVNSPPNPGSTRNMRPTGAISPVNPGSVRNAPVSSNSPPNPGALRNAPVSSNSPPNQGALRNAPVSSNSPPNPGALRGGIAPSPAHPDFGSSTQTKPGSPAGVAGLLSQDAGAAAQRAKALKDLESLQALKDASWGPVAPAVAPPATVPTAAVPALAPPTVIAPTPPVYQPRPVSQVAPIAMRPTPTVTAGDVYAGLADTAMDNTGRNRVSSIPGGTSVTNKYGATTGMVGGYQTAVGSMPSIPGMKAPDLGTFGQKAKGALPTVAGAAAGGLLAGPLGALLGAALAKAVQPGGALNRQSFQTNAFGTINAAKAKGGLGFPDRPTMSFLDAAGNTVRGYTGPASFSNRSPEGMRSISPGAAAAIGAGKGGLY